MANLQARIHGIAAAAGPPGGGGAAAGAPTPHTSAVVDNVMPLMQQLVLLLSEAGEPITLSREQSATTLYLLESVLAKLSVEACS